MALHSEESNHDTSARRPKRRRFPRRWCGITPLPFAHYVDVTSWTVTEHEDRTITVGPFFGILVTQCVGPFTLRREFAVVEEGV